MNLAALTFVAVSFFMGPDKVTVFVANDYIKADEIDYVWWSGQNVEGFLRNNPSMTYPPRFVVDKVWRQAGCQLKPQPINPNVPHIQITHGSMIKNQKFDVGQECFITAVLTAGHKKDIVRPTDPSKTAIYGWHRLNGKIIQPYSQVHGKRYRDYSHGFRPMLKTIFVNGQPQPYQYLRDVYGLKL